MHGYYMIFNKDETAVMCSNERMLPLGHGFPFTTLLKSSAEQWIEKWKADMVAAGCEPYELVIKYIE